MPRRRSSPASQAGVTVEATIACSTVTASSGRHAGTLVDRAEDAGADPGERIELLDRGVGAVRDDGAGLEQAAEGVRSLQPIPPEALREVAVGGRVRELDGAGDADRGEAGNVRGVEALRVLDPLAQAERLPGVLRRLERIERVAVRPVADRVHRDRPAGGGRAPDDVLELLPARDPDAGAVEHQRRLRAERPVHERLQVAEPEEVVAEPRPERERGELGKAVGGERLPDAEGQPVALVDATEDRGGAEPAVLVVNRGDAAGVRDPDALPGRVDELVLADGDEAVAEAPGRLLPQDPGRLARRRPARRRRPAASSSPPARARPALLSQSEW